MQKTLIAIIFAIFVLRNFSAESAPDSKVTTDAKQNITKTKMNCSTGSITSHVLDIGLGRPGANVETNLFKKNESSENWEHVGRDVTNEDGRMKKLLNNKILEAGVYKLIFETGKYYAERNLSTFYPRVTIEFTVANCNEHFHVPIVISQYGYSTYRGS